jgi:VWFA-related protein
MPFHHGRIACRFFGFARLPIVSVLFAMLSVPAMAAVNLRVEGRPADQPIQAFVRVTDDVTGDPIEGLAAGDFAVTIDGDPVTISGVTLPPDQSATQRVSIIFAMDYSLSVTTVAEDAMEQAVIDFVAEMTAGDQVAIIKFNDTNPTRASVVLPFTAVSANNAAIDAAVLSDYPGDGTNLLDALELGVNHFLSPPAPVPAGPKAIVLISDGGENESEISEFEVVTLASANSIPIFTIGVGDLTIPRRVELMTDLATDTGGQFFPTATDQEIADAYASIELLLTSEYLVTIPNGITDCAVHTMEVTVAGQAAPATAQFTRRICDAEPNPFSFTAQTGLETSTAATSDAVTILGLEVESHVGVIQGDYSIGCTGTFTNNPGTIADGETVCVRQTTAGNFSTSKTTTLTIGGIAGTFTTTTRARTGSDGGGGGGGGATGPLALLLLGLGALLLGRRRMA